MMAYRNVYICICVGCWLVGWLVGILMYFFLYNILSSPGYNLNPVTHQIYIHSTKFIITQSRYIHNLKSVGYKITLKRINDNFQ